MNKTLKEIQEDFDVKGIFPSDAELHFALIMNIPRGKAEYTNVSDILLGAMDWEFDMIHKAMNDIRHPYHHMVSGQNPLYCINFNQLN